MTNYAPGNAVISTYAFTLDGVGNRTQTDLNEPLALGYNAETVNYTYSPGNILNTTLGTLLPTLQKILDEQGLQPHSVNAHYLPKSSKYCSLDIPAVLRLFFIIDIGISLYIGITIGLETPVFM